jgi:hypothetical protein
VKVVDVSQQRLVGFSKTPEAAARMAMIIVSGTQDVAPGNG